MQDLGVGVCLKPQHFQEILSTSPPVGWFEVHSENYMGQGGPSLSYLEAICANYPLSLHGVSLSLGSDEGLNQEHLQRLKILVDRFKPALVSEHLSWSRIGDTYLNDLIALPYNEASLDIICTHIQETQDYLQRTIAIENPSSYVTFKASTIEEPDFLAQLVKRTGCKLLLDVNNIFVSGNNNHFDPQEYIDSIPTGVVQEIHLAGHSKRKVGEHYLCIDDHGSEVSEKVWDLYKLAIARFGAIPTLIEWDTDVPVFKTLLQEASRAEQILYDCQEEQHAATV